MKNFIYVSVIAFFFFAAVIGGVMIYDCYKKADTQEKLYESLAQIAEQSETGRDKERYLLTVFLK